MTAQISFWTPVDYRLHPPSFGRQLEEWADSYFYLGGKIAVVAPRNSEKEHLHVRLENRKRTFWKTALKVASYATLILPILLFAIKAVARVTRSYRLAPIRVSKPPVDTQIRVVKGKSFFLKPHLLLEGMRLGDVELNFAEIRSEKKREVIPVQRLYCEDESNRIEKYIRYPGSPLEALLKMAQGRPEQFSILSDRHQGSPIKYILNHPNNCHINRRAFLDYLLTPNEKGAVLLQTIEQESLLEVLQIAKEMNVPIDLNREDPRSCETLFSQWVGRGFIFLTERFLELDPRAIQQTTESEVSFLTQAILNGHLQEAHLLHNAMKTQQIQFRETDAWLAKVLENDTSFKDEEFLLLSPLLKRKIWRGANIMIRNDFILRLRLLGMGQSPIPPRGAALLSGSMDAVEVERTLEEFILNLQKHRLLMTKEEFNKLDREHFFYKNADVGRILGRDYIEKTAQRLGLDSIKVPKKIGVFAASQEGVGYLPFKISRDGAMDLFCPTLEIYAEKIVPIERKATRDEMVGLLDLLKETGYNDFFGHNFMMGKNQSGEEGIYCIDTEYTNFKLLPCYDFIENLKTLLSRDDWNWFYDTVAERKRRHNQIKEELEEREMMRAQKANEALHQSGFTQRRLSFILRVV